MALESAGATCAFASGMQVGMPGATGLGGFIVFGGIGGPVYEGVAREGERRRLRASRESGLVR